MGVLYVVEQGAMVHRHRERLVVRKDRRDLVEVPLVHVDLVALFGGTHLTTAATGLLLDRAIPVAYCSATGRLRGFLQPAPDRWGANRIAQCQRLDDRLWRLEMARSMVVAKLRNQRTIVRRLERRERARADGVADLVTGRIRAAEQATTEDQLRGIEGAGAAAYFRVLRQALEPLASDHRGPRARQPGDALLNLAYTLLAVDVLRAVQLAGLDPSIGAYHRPRLGRFNLVLDLMEEWRPVLADLVAAASVGLGVVGTGDFVTGPMGEVRLTNKAMRRLVGEYHRRAETDVASVPGGRPRPYREWVDRQARLYARALRSDAERYQGFVAR